MCEVCKVCAGDTRGRGCRERNVERRSDNNSGFNKDGQGRGANGTRGREALPATMRERALVAIPPLAWRRCAVRKESGGGSGTGGAGKEGKGEATPATAADGTTHDGSGGKRTDVQLGAR